METPVSLPATADAELIDPRQHELVSIPWGVIRLVRRLTRRRVSPGAVRHWILAGIYPRAKRGTKRERVRLQSIRIGAKSYTTEEAVLEFARAAGGVALHEEAK